MRSVAPDSAGTAASQNSWLGVYLKPMFGRLTTATLHTCQMANASSKAGIEIQRLRRATARPSCCQKAEFSGSQRVRTCALMVLSPRPHAAAHQVKKGMEGIRQRQAVPAAGAPAA